MKQSDLDSMPIDELFMLHERLSAIAVRDLRQPISDAAKLFSGWRRFPRKRALSVAAPHDDR
jgi:hypothetical protein